MAGSIYLDHAATTPLRPEVRAAMEPYLAGSFANPSSIYRLAQEGRSAIDAARDSTAGLLGASPAEIVFTSGGTESDNAAIKGVALASLPDRRHIVTTAIEHHAVLHPCEDAEKLWGFEVTVVPVQESGIVDPADVAATIRPDTALVSVMWANNEIGTIQPIEEIAAITRVRGVPLHVDAVQAAGTLPIDLSTLPIDLLTLSAHKFYGPKGIGLLFVRTGTPWWPLITGGPQERNRRAGTENVAGIVGMARALELACAEREETNVRLRSLRDLLISELSHRIPDVLLNGDRVYRLPGNANLLFPGVHGESLLVGLDLAGIMASSGSACASGSTEPSHVLRAIGLSDRQASSSVRFTLGRENTRADVERTVEVLDALVARLRAAAPVR